MHGQSVHNRDMPRHLVIEYADPRDYSDSVSIPFRLHDSAVTAKWIERVKTAQALGYAIDDPGRFYGYGTWEEQAKLALESVQSCINVVNQHSTIINRQLTNIQDQDTLNYLHNIFELHHGLLDQQTTPTWANAPQAVQQALAELNVLVHRCESINAGSIKRHVVTWYGLPKTQQLAESDYRHFIDNWPAGTVHINYVEIGKTMTDLALDRDQYISSQAFKPFKFYSADFGVKISASDPQKVAERLAQVHEYYQKNIEFFGAWQACYATGILPVAQVLDPRSLDQIETRQFVKSVSFT